MFSHLLKLTWKRKSRNLMLSLEIMLAFAVVFAVAAASVIALRLYQLPIGFTYQDVWAVEINGGRQMFDQMEQLSGQFMQSVEEMPEVEDAAFSSTTPYSMGSWTSRMRSPATGKALITEMMSATDEYFDVAGVKVVEGRRFSDLDNGTATVPVVINRLFAQRMFSEGSVIGKEFEFGKRTMKVVGVIEEFRSKGELSLPANFTIVRAGFVKDSFIPTTMLVRLKPGTARAFEVKLQRRLMQVRNDWAFKITPLRELRTNMLKSVITPLVVLAIVGAFMLLMVSFGLFGVLWQNTMRRTPEIGLRRAIGASAAGIYRQIVAEQMLLSTGAMLVGLVLLIQLPLTGALGEVLSWKVFCLAAAVSMAVIYLISLLCALYPGWRASRISPTEALHYE